jgi:hypothetical protein
MALTFRIVLVHVDGCLAVPECFRTGLSGFQHDFREPLLATIATTALWI